MALEAILRIGVTNEELEHTIDTNDEWIRNNLGICQRRVAAPEESTSSLAIAAARRAIENAGILSSEVDMIIVSTATPDRLAPATAPKVQAAIGATNAAAFDLNAVCAGFIYGLTVGAQFVGTGASHNVLVIGADTFPG